MIAAKKPTPGAVAPVLALAKTRKLPSIREWAESRPAVDPVLIQRLARSAK